MCQQEFVVKPWGTFAEGGRIRSHKLRRKEREVLFGLPFLLYKVRLTKLLDGLVKSMEVL